MRLEKQLCVNRSHERGQLYRMIHVRDIFSVVVARLGYDEAQYCRNGTTFRDIFSMPTSGFIKTRILVFMKPRQSFTQLIACVTSNCLLFCDVSPTFFGPCKPSSGRLFTKEYVYKKCCLIFAYMNLK